MKVDKCQFFVFVLCMPGKLSQAPPAEIRIIGCGRHPEVPVTVEI